MKNYLMLVCFLFANAAYSQGGGGASTGNKFDFSLGLMALQNSTEQGGQGTSGSTILTQSEFNWHRDWYGAGLFVQYDKQGSAQTDSAAGPKIEFVWQTFFLEIGYSLFMNRAFTDRSIADQKGQMYFVGVGSRFFLASGGGAGGGGSGSGAFFLFQYKYRVQTINKQDGRGLDEPIIQKDIYPLLGFGYGF